MSPLLLRRYRAERLLRQEFDGLRAQVLAVVRGRLRSRGVQLDAADLEALYATAWQGLYATVLEGQEVANPAGWLVLVTFRRAIDEHRARLHEDRAELPSDTLVAEDVGERDLAQELDDRDRLRHLFEGLRGRLNARECQAASLCYLQGLSRSEAAVQMGISDARLRKLMEGDGRKGPGVAGKVGELLDTISAGGWCEQQSSLMRGLAFGILDPGGERYRLAQLHRRECPACRAYVRSLRGLASVLPPIALPWGLGGGGAVAGGAGAGVAGGVSAGTLSASGVAGVGGAGGGWLLAGGSVGAKLAVGCLLALGFGAGCVALTRGHPHDAHGARRHVAGVDPQRVPIGAGAAALSATREALRGVAPSAAGSSSTGRTPAIAARARAEQPRLQAQREFGLQRTLASRASGSSSAPTARPASILKSSTPVDSTAHPASPQGAGVLQREFGAG